MFPEFILREIFISPISYIFKVPAVPSPQGSKIFSAAKNAGLLQLGPTPSSVFPAIFAAVVVADPKNSWLTDTAIS